MTNLQTILTIAILINVAFGFLLLYFFLLVSAKEKPDDYQDNFKEVKDKSYDILGDALKKADKIITNAELRGIKLFAQEKLEEGKMSKEYQGRLRALEQKLAASFETRINDAEKSYLDFTSFIEKNFQDHIDQNQKLLTDKTVSFIQNTENLINTSIQNTQEKIKTELTKEFTLAKQEIDEYKRKRLAVIDQNIVDILEKTLSLALGKKLSLSDQAELIYKALEEAKKEHAFT